MSFKNRQKMALLPNHISRHVCANEVLKSRILMSLSQPGITEAYLFLFYFTFVLCILILSIIKYYSPTNALVSCLKINIKIYIKIPYDGVTVTVKHVGDVLVQILM